MRRGALSIVVVLASTGATRGEISGPVPGTILSLAVDPSAPEILYVCVAGRGLLQSSDGGTSWSRTGPGLPLGQDVTIVTTAGSPTVAFATVTNGVFRSTDRGATWTAAGSGLPTAAAVYGALKPSATLYASTGDHLYRSQDGGLGWNRADSGLPAEIDSVVADPAAGSVAYTGSRDGLFRTADAGATWTKTGYVPGLSSIHHVSSMAVDPNRTATVYAVTINCGFSCGFSNLQRTDDAGGTWKGLAAGVLSPVWTDAASTVYAGSDDGFRSFDRGETWLPIGPLPADLDRFFAFPHSGLVYASTVAGLLYASTDHGSTWRALAPPGTACDGAAFALCLGGGGRFVATVRFGPPGAEGPAQAIPITANTGAFWFFSADNLELVLKVLDGRSINGKFWVFYGSLTDVAFTLTIVDTESGAIRTYVNAAGALASLADTSAF